MQHKTGSVLFADLMSFSGISETLDAERYFLFIKEFRETVFGSISEYLGSNEVLLGFWGDEIKVIFHGPDLRENAVRACRCGCLLQDAWIRSDLGTSISSGDGEVPRFKIGIATGPLAVGPFAGAPNSDIEGLPLCRARTLSKEAKAELGNRIYLDSETERLIVGEVFPMSFRRLDLE